MSSHGAFKPTTQSTTAFNWATPPPPTFTCPRPLSAPITSPSSHHSSMHLASRTTSRNRGAARYPKPLPSQSLQKSACRPAVEQPPRGICLTYRAEMSRCDSTLWLLQLSLLKLIWLVFSVTGGSDRLHLVVVTSFFSFWTSRCLEPTPSYILPLTLLELVVLSSSLRFCPTSSSSSSSPHMCSTVQHPPPLPFSPRFYLHPSLSLHCSLHLDPKWLGRTAGGSTHVFLLVQDLSASGMET